jgi:hypothetical protein
MVARFLLDGAVQDRLRCLAKEHSLKTRVILVALSLAGYGLFGTLANEWARPVAVQEATHGMAIEAPASLPQAIATQPRSIAALPTVTSLEEPAPPRAGYAAASLPALEPLPVVATLPTVTPPQEPKEPKRSGCDPAYPDKRTCIPPGPPFDQGCAITSERRFEVLPPDPQGLDHDGDGIGCEPIRGST